MSCEVELERAWRWRTDANLLRDSSAVRVFHGPGEGTGECLKLAVDQFGEHFWITFWGDRLGEQTRSKIAAFLESKGAKSVSLVARPKGELASDSITILGEPPEGRFQIWEGELRLLAQMKSARQTGIFLDHSPLRRWLLARAKGWSVLNTFSYTGSLSVAAGLGGAREVVSLDLSKPALRWAEDNWKLNELDPKRAEFIDADYFKRVPQYERSGRRFDCVILDPPSFSRASSGGFSTARDLVKLHHTAFGVVKPGGILVTSINSANVTTQKLESEILTAAQNANVRLQVLGRIELPETFPTQPARGNVTPFSAPEERYLKGWMLRVLEAPAGRAGSKR